MKKLQIFKTALLLDYKNYQSVSGGVRWQFTCTTGEWWRIVGPLLLSEVPLERGFISLPRRHDTYQARWIWSSPALHSIAYLYVCISVHLLYTDYLSGIPAEKTNLITNPTSLHFLKFFFKFLFCLITWMVDTVKLTKI